MTQALLFSVFLIATCGLIYELIAGTLASYLIGDSVTQFSTVIGTYLFSMGIGSYLSQYIGANLISRFVQVELLVGLVGGYSAALMFVGFAYTQAFRFILYVVVVIVGTLVGLEIPLLLRILKDKLRFENLVAQILTLDYVGALIASLLFPLVLVPRLGLMRSAFLFGALNALVALWSTWIFKDHIRGIAFLRGQCLLVLGLLVAGGVSSTELSSYTEDALYSDDVIYSRRSAYQQVVLTRWRDDLRLYLNGHLQFSSRDEYRYHEALVHVGLSGVPAPRRVLVLGGGDGLAVREILKCPSVTSITLVDLDAMVTQLFSEKPPLCELNHRALLDPRVTILNQDAFPWLEASTEFFDFIVVDFPDPNNYSVGKLYTTAFYRLLKKHLSEQGVAVIQATSPLFARASFWTIATTLETAGFRTQPYHVYVPSFGEWGFVLASHGPFRPCRPLPANLKFLTEATFPSLFTFPPDMGRLSADPNRLNDQTLVRTYEADWQRNAP